MKLKKVFGIISYFPDNDSEYHIETRRERSRRFKELLYRLEELWPDTDILVIAQNWQDFKLPTIKNHITVLHYNKLGILGARRELRKQFLASEYDYLIMLDDDARIINANPNKYMEEIDNHPSGIGVIRRRMCPLMFLAISKDIYSQIDMPDIDAENDGGFEDDIFVAQCFSTFPDKAFDFSEDCIEEFSLHYNGPGKCPSTWAREKKHDWDYMRRTTDAKLYQLEHPEYYKPTKPSENPTIDLVVTYVNSSDALWRKDYITATKTHNPSQVRFRSWGTLKYLFRGVERYMPFIRQIVLIVARPSQVPVWVNKDTVRVVYHEDFIPKQFLPTFNSCVIESYMWNIPGLADRVIYVNDDIFPTGPMQESDFFTGNIPHIQFRNPISYSTRTIYESQCRSGQDMITDVLKLPRFETGKVLMPHHISMAITKSCFEQVGRLCTEVIPKTVTRLRTTQNVNQYIYAYYQYYTDNYINSTVDFKYYEITDKSFNEITEEILQENHQMLCLNDSDKLKDFARTRYLLDHCFSKKFPIKSRYEI